MNGIGWQNFGGAQVVAYDYDAWGNLLSVTGDTTLANLNPLRYRGYYYDTETGFYYLQSRYYDPVTQRFINADGYVSTGQGLLGFNMFAYCGNNPIARQDPNGQGWITALIVTAVVVTITHVVATKIKAKKDYRKNAENEKNASLNTTVNSQKAQEVKSLTVGAGTVEKNGCAAVAVHNVKVVKGVASTLSETIYDIQNEGGLLLDGLLGANPLILDDVLEDYGIQSTPVSAEELLNPGLYLIAYWNSPDTIFDGAHFVVIEFDGTNHRTYNGTNYHPSTYSDSYIYGYRIS